MELTIEHLAPYLFYRLNIIDIETKEVLELTYKGDLMKVIGKNHFQYSLLSPSKHKPILRPLSDIESFFKPMFETDKDVNYYLSDFFLEMHNIMSISELAEIDPNFWPVGTYKLLLKYHFDVNKLIDADLAVDMNTL